MAQGRHSREGGHESLIRLQRAVPEGRVVIVKLNSKDSLSCWVLNEP